MIGLNVEQIKKLSKENKSIYLDLNVHEFVELYEALCSVYINLDDSDVETFSKPLDETIKTLRKVGFETGVFKEV